MGECYVIEQIVFCVANQEDCLFTLSCCISWVLALSACCVSDVTFDLHFVLADDDVQAIQFSTTKQKSEITSLLLWNSKIRDDPFYFQHSLSKLVSQKRSLPKEYDGAPPIRAGYRSMLGSDSLIPQEKLKIQH